MSRGAIFLIALAMIGLVFAEGWVMATGVSMNEDNIWILLFVAGVVAFMVGVLIGPRLADGVRGTWDGYRLLTVIGAILTVVGGVGWFIQSLD